MNLENLRHCVLFKFNMTYLKNHSTRNIQEEIFHSSMAYDQAIKSYS